MPISTNAPFNEFGQSQILRDIEQLYLALNGAGNGAPGDGQTQDQTEVTSQDSGGLPDLSNLATIPYVDAAIAAIPGVTYPISIANGGTGQTSQQAAINALSSVVTKHYALVGDGSNVTMRKLPTVGTLQTLYNTGGTGTYTVPAGVYFLYVIVVGAGGGGDTFGTVSASTFYVANSSGGSPTQAITNSALGGGGGSAGVACVFLPVTPGDTFSYRVAPAASGGSAGTESRFGDVYAYGGQFGGTASATTYMVEGGAGGAGGEAVLASRFGVAIPGQRGEKGRPGVAGAGAFGVVIDGGQYGYGGDGTGGTGGCIAIFY